VPVAQLAITIRSKDTQKPVRGALVKAGTASGTTDGSGVCVLKVPPETEVEVKASAEGYLPRSTTGKTPAAGESRTIGWFLEPVGKQAGPPVKPSPPAGKDPQHLWDGTYSMSFDDPFSSNGTISFTINKSIVQGSFNGTQRDSRSGGKKITAFAGTFRTKTGGVAMNFKSFGITVPITSGHYDNIPFRKDAYVIIRFEVDGRVHGEFPFGAYFKNY